eukprot:507016_1
MIQFTGVEEKMPNYYRSNLIPTGRLPWAHISLCLLARNSCQATSWPHKSQTSHIYLPFIIPAGKKNCKKTALGIGGETRMLEEGMWLYYSMTLLNVKPR